MTDLLERLAGLLPPPPSVEPVEWASVEAALGTPLPADFKAFGDRWGFGGVEDSAFTIFAPLTDAVWMVESLGEEMDDGDLERRPLWPEPGGLLPWASTESTKWYLLWDTAGEPDTWTVVLHDVDFTETGLTFLEYLVGALSAELPEELVPDELWVPPDAPAAGSRGHRWYAEEEASSGSGSARGGADTAAMQVLRSWGQEDGAWSVSTDFATMLGTERDEALPRFLAWLDTNDPATRARITRTRLRRSEEELEVATGDDLEPVARAAVAFVAAETGATVDREELDELFVDSPADEWGEWDDDEV